MTSPLRQIFNGRRFVAQQVDSQVRSSALQVLVVAVTHLDRGAVGRQHLDVQAQRLQLLEQHLERLRNARLGDVLALDDRLVHLDPADGVVGLDGQQLLQRVRRAVGLHGPALHLTEPLAAELRLTAQRLLGDHRVRGSGADSRPCSSASRAPSNTGVETMLFGSTSSIPSGRLVAHSGEPSIFQPLLAHHPRWVSRIWPMFMRRGTPWVFRMMSTGVPSGRNGMSSTARILPMTPLLPWRPASLSPSEILRFCATYTRTNSLTPAGSSS